MVDLKKEIMEQSRHNFIYGYNNANRRQLIDDIKREYPVVIDDSKPIAIEVKDYGIPNYHINYDGIEYNKLLLIGNEYFEFAAFYSILKETFKNYDEKYLNKKLASLYRLLNKNVVCFNPIEIKDYRSLLTAIEESKDFYHGSYKDYVEKGIDYKPIDSVTIPFLNLGTLLKLYKDSINNQSYFGLIIDKQKPIAKASTMAINLYTGSRINDDISMKIFTDPNDWESYVSSNGEMVQECHDYRSIEIDDSIKNFIKVKKKINRL